MANSRTEGYSAAWQGRLVPELCVYMHATTVPACSLNCMSSKETSGLLHLVMHLQSCTKQQIPCRRRSYTAPGSASLTQTAYWRKWHTTMPQEEREAEQESGEDSDEWTDEEDADTPIDELDPFMLFSNTLQQLQTQNPGRFQVGTLWH